jgi:phenol hydroxylase P5 protein
MTGTHQLTVEPLGETIDIEEGQSILDACLRHGIWLPYACGHGRCSTCKVDVLEGEIEHGDASSFALMDFERDEGKALACCATVQSDVVIEAEVEEDDDAENHPIGDYVGRVVRTEQLTPLIRGVWLELPGEGVRFQAGQYINVTVPGVPGPRAFSLANPPSQPNLVELHVRRVEGGAATSWIHDELEEGMEVRFTGPLGRFYVRKSHEKPCLFVGGGSGLSSPKSMVLDLLETGFDEPVTLIQGARDLEHAYFKDLFEGLAEEHDNFRYVPALSDCDDSSWTGARGFAHEAMEALYGGKFSGNSAYLCGPPQMVEACIRSLMKGRLFEKDIFTEKFINNADGDAALARSPLFKRI